MIGEIDIIEVSALEGTRIDVLEETIVKKLSDNALTANGGALLSNMRHRELLRQGCEELLKAANNLEAKLSIEFIADDIKSAVVYIDEIVGTNVTDEVLHLIFERFCVGK